VDSCCYCYNQGWARDRDVSVSRPIHGLVSALRPNVSVSVSRADISVSILTFQISSPLLFLLKFTCDDSLLKLSALISSIEAPTIIRAECSRNLLSECLLPLLITLDDYNWWPWWRLTEVLNCATSRLGLISGGLRSRLGLFSAIKANVSVSSRFRLCLEGWRLGLVSVFGVNVLSPSLVTT